MFENLYNDQKCINSDNVIKKNYTGLPTQDETVKMT